MIYFSCFAESKKAKFTETDLKLLIVRKPPAIIPMGYIHVPQLSPSEELFNRTQRWKRNDFSEIEISFIEDSPSYQGKKEWWPLYVREFKRELQTRPDMLKALERLKKLSNQQNIICFCFCKDKDECHRGLIGMALENEGYEVCYDLNDFKK